MPTLPAEAVHSVSQLGVSVGMAHPEIIKRAAVTALR
jgi:hypothetical protein